MKTISTIISAAVIVLCLNACKKNDNGSVGNEIVGKWHEDKLMLKQATSNSSEHDTTFASTAFTANDYVQFNADKTASFSQSGDFGFAGKRETINGTAVSGVSGYNYFITDISFGLTKLFAHPTNGFDPYDYKILQLDNKQLIIQTKYNVLSAPISTVGYNNSLITTAYYTREN
ncbi:hypothetical protein [Mucilaginibacter sp. SP1R1]|uniref:hypothetical protein n=1 Tax=Mucilaginibacter sp. SP1R1 TaxID=2723091 RepID=UPI00161AC2BC|nr:hypothetical protein [Mucilaginibacter sp. SP1R1]MBB6152775.1 hypothetical protein [Mucilaginibacter sp. SP1R1]